jgi:hypothetical protein
MATAADSPVPTAAPQPARNDDASSSNAIKPPPNAARLREVFDAIQEAERAVSETVQNMARPRAN